MDVINKAASQIKIRNIFGFPFKENGQVFYDLEECGRCYGFVVDSSIFDNVS